MKEKLLNQLKEIEIQTEAFDPSEGLAFVEFDGEDLVLKELVYVGDTCDSKYTTTGLIDSWVMVKQDDNETIRVLTEICGLKKEW